MEGLKRAQFSTTVVTLLYIVLCLVENQASTHIQLCRQQPETFTQKSY